MSPRFDFRCLHCGTIREDVWVSNFKDATDSARGTDYAPCEGCGGVLEKLPAAPSFRVTGFNAKNSYGVKS